MITKIGLAVYHANARTKYPDRWITKCLNSLIGVNSPHWCVRYYELDYGDKFERFIGADGAPDDDMFKYRRKKLANYAEAMNEIYSWIFEECEVVCNVNIDDYYDMWRMEKLLESLEDGADIVSSNYIAVDENDNELRRTDFAGLNIADELARDNNIVSNPAHMMKRHVFEKLKFDPSLVPREDLQYWKDCLGAGFKIVIRPEHLHYYRIHPGQSGNQK